MRNFLRIQKSRQRGDNFRGPFVDHWHTKKGNKSCAAQDRFAGRTGFQSLRAVSGAGQGDAQGAIQDLEAMVDPSFSLESLRTQS